MATPFLALGAILLYQKLAYAEFWNSVQHDEAHIAGLQAGAELIQGGFAMGIGLLLGSILAIVSIKLRKRILCLGLLALSFNALPLISLAAVLVFGRINGV